MLILIFCLFIFFNADFQLSHLSFSNRKYISACCCWSQMIFSWIIPLLNNEPLSLFQPPADVYQCFQHLLVIKLILKALLRINSDIVSQETKKWSQMLLFFFTHKYICHIGKHLPRGRLLGPQPRFKIKGSTEAAALVGDEWGCWPRLAKAICCETRADIYSAIKHPAADLNIAAKCCTSFLLPLPVLL